MFQEMISARFYLVDDAGLKLYKIAVMKLHPRYFIVKEARQEFGEFMLDLEQKYSLIFAEIVGILSEELGTCVKYEIRAERQKKGDEA